MAKKESNVDKNEKLKVSKSVNEEQKEIVSFVVILLVIVGVVLIIYLISDGILNKNVYNFDSTNTGAINYDTVSVGTMFNRANEEYYVALYDQEDVNAVYYTNLINNYSYDEDALKVYFCDLGNPLNADYVAKEGESSNPSAVSIEDLVLGEFTFVKIKDGKIVKYLETVEDMEAELEI